jgi:hypothetical protein
MILPRPVEMGGIRKQDQKQDQKQEQSSSSTRNRNRWVNRSRGGRSRNSSVGYIRNGNTGGAGTVAAVTEAGTQQEEEQKQTYRIRNR